MKKTRRKMRPGGGKAKGSSFEREICKLLSLWITRNARDDVLWRSAMSGGRATVHAKRGKQMAHVAGDICSVHPAGVPFVDKFYVELKTYRDLKIPQLLFAGGGTLAEFWDETVTLAAANRKLPMLIFKQNQYAPMVGLNALGLEEFSLVGSMYVRANFWNNDLAIITLDALLHLEAPRLRMPFSSRPRKIS